MGRPAEIIAVFEIYLPGGFAASSDAIDHWGSDLFLIENSK
jgi:hypothetical protein